MSKPALATFLMVTYNQENYVEDAVNSALSQTFSNLEIIISDDCSTDQTFHIIKRIVDKYKGMHKVILIRNNENLGLCSHVNKVVKMASGYFIVMSAGDDISDPRRSEFLLSALLKSQGKMKGIFSNAVRIDKHGGQDGLQFLTTPIFNRNIGEFKIKQRCWVLGATFAFDKEIFTKYGELPKGFQEDGILAFRAILEGEIGYVAEPLVKYRHHGSNISDPNNAYKRLIFQKSRFILNKSWLSDALKYHENDKELILRIKFLLLQSTLLKFFLMLPFVGLFCNSIIVFARKFLKNNS